jgi:uncharacterized membrane protein (UPF0127 family)
MGAIRPRHGLLIRTRYLVHTFLMSKHIDCVYLDDSCRVVGVREEMRPWSILFLSRQTTMVLELRAGEVKRLKIASSTQLNLLPVAKREIFR